MNDRHFGTTVSINLSPTEKAFIEKLTNDLIAEGRGRAFSQVIRSAINWANINRTQNSIIKEPIGEPIKYTFRLPSESHAELKLQAKDQKNKLGEYLEKLIRIYIWNHPDVSVKASHFFR